MFHRPSGDQILRFLTSVFTICAPVFILCSIVAGNEPVHYRLQDLAAMSVMALALALSVIIYRRRADRAVGEKAALQERLDSAIGAMRDQL